MKVYYEPKHESEETRSHPWICSLHDASNKYYDFKKNPDLIPQVLEDFKPWSTYRAIQLYYEMLRWLNSESSALESNDCAFKGPEDNIDKLFPRRLRCLGRLMVLYRDLRLNVSNDHIDWLLGRIGSYLEEIDPEFEFGVIGFTFLKVYYRELPVEEEKRSGRLLQLSWWAYGDREEEVMINLERTFSNLFEALKHISKEILESTSSVSDCNH